MYRFIYRMKIPANVNSKHVDLQNESASIPSVENDDNADRYSRIQLAEAKTVCHSLCRRMVIRKVGLRDPRRDNT